MPCHKNLTIEQQITSNTNISLITNSIKPYHSTKNSKLYTAIDELTGDKVLIKKVTSDDFNLQWKSLRQATALLTSQSDFKTPKLISVSSEFQIIYMEYIRGVNLRRALYLRQNLKSRIELIHGAARWLAAFHRQLATQDDRFNPTSKLDDIEIQFDKYQASYKSSQVIRRAINWLNENAVGVSLYDTYWGAFHGDFKPENLIRNHDNQDIYGVDFVLTGNSCQLMDIAQFINQILFMCLNISGYRIYFRREPMAREFVNIYQNLRGDFSYDLLLWLRLEHLLRYYFEKKALPGLFARFESDFLHREIARLINNI